ncbi:hypothetical protein B0H10DRAFT_1940619 [Mycena sp. CBHHK59/15]|nr:hypothetical protein B0H10DRAFT_1940619 [Mycena sp. CBHHK59/15]
MLRDKDLVEFALGFQPGSRFSRNPDPSVSQAWQTGRDPRGYWTGFGGPRRGGIGAGVTLASESASSRLASKGYSPEDAETRPPQVICRCLLIPALPSLLLRGALGNLGGDYFLRIFYRDFQGDPKHVQEGYCQSRYLVKSYKSVFTAPSSAEKDDDENTPPMKKAKTAGPNGKCVAVILNMDGKVTGRSIAYVAVLLWLSLTTTTAWIDEYYDVSLAQMYDFIVDYFEGPEEGTLARERIDALLAWWNKQIYPAHASSTATNKTSVASRAALREQRAAMESA